MITFGSTNTTMLAPFAIPNWKTCDCCEKWCVPVCGFLRPLVLGRGGFAQGAVLPLGLLSWRWLCWLPGHIIVRLEWWRLCLVHLLWGNGNQSWRYSSYGIVLCVVDF